MEVYYPCNPQEESVEVATPEEFVAFYSRVYAYANRGSYDDEKRIVGILRGGIRCPEDVEAVMEWKTGDRWKVDNCKVFQAIEGRHPETFREAKAFVEKARGVEGIGPVFAITLLYFASKGKWPIYDQFAGRGLLAVQQGMRPMPGKAALGALKGDLLAQFNASRKSWFEDYAKNFASCLAQGIEGVGAAKPEGENAELLRYLAENYAKSRDVDRALWAYGHLFS